MTAIYVRQSVEREDSISAESQTELCRFEAKGAPCRVYADIGYSGKNTDRPQFRRLVADIRRGEITAVIVYRLDRISRSILDFANMMTLFERYRVEFLSSTEKFDTSAPVGRAMLNICMVFAQLERETIQQRVTDAYYSRSGKGFYMGGRVPYGFRLAETSLHGKKTKTYVPEPEEAALVRKIYERYADPAASYGDVTAFFAALGILCRGKPWSRARVAACLKNPAYVRADAEVCDFFRMQGAQVESPREDFIGTNGCYFYQGRGAAGRKRTQLKDGRLVLAPHEGIVPADLWLACRVKCLRNRQVQTGRKVHNTWLAGLLKCGICRYALTCKKYPDRRVRYFLCSRKMNSGACAGPGLLHADELENLIGEEIVRRLKEFPVLPAESGRRGERPESAALRAKRDGAERELRALSEKVAFADGVLLARIGKRMEELESLRVGLERRLLATATECGTEQRGAEIRNPAALWGKLPQEDKRKAAAALIEVVYATAEEVKIYWKI